MRILSVIGTRPEALKMGPVLWALAARPEFESVVCATGQHRALLQRALAQVGVKPDFDLDVMQPGQTPAAVLAVLLARLGPLVRRVRPDWILAVGDTTSVLAASLTAARHQVRFGHVEAGLRTDCLWDPFPEEFNRRLISVLATVHFAPTAQARRNLRRENIPARRIVVTGNPIIDTLRHFQRQAPARPHGWRRRLGVPTGAEPPPRLLVVTFHRRENIGRPMRGICSALRDLARIYGDRICILCLVHPNPAVREPALRQLRGVPSIRISLPLDYPAMLAVLERAHCVLTDSGGLQEEAPTLGKPVLVLRRRTERPEGVAAGVAAIVGTARRDIVAAARRLLDHPAAHRAMSRRFRGYGDGHAAERIVRVLLREKLPALRELPNRPTVRVRAAC
jgi:UDP-N-acetylglucosamine 2-epimerase (non-hydrolysing)